jgi:hypothetical protein
MGSDKPGDMCEVLDSNITLLSIGQRYLVWVFCLFICFVLCCYPVLLLNYISAISSHFYHLTT